MLTHDDVLKAIAAHKGGKLNAKMLSKELDYSINTIHNRIKDLEAQGKIRRYYRIEIIEGEDE